MTVRGKLSLTALALAGLCGCTSSGVTESAVGAVPFPMPTGTGPIVLPTHYSEPKPNSRALELQLEAGRIYSVCDAWEQVLALPEPHPDDLRELVTYGRRYHQTLVSVDPRAEMIDTSAAVENKKITAPAEVLEAVQTQRAAMYRYMVQLMFAEAANGEAEDITDRAAQIIERAMIDLASSEYTEADATVQAFYEQHC